MEIIKVSAAAPSPFALNKIVKILKAGRVIAFPTDTAYGLGAAFLNQKAIKKIYRIKKRSAQKHIGFICSDLKQAKRFFFFNKKELSLAKKYWPGPLTLVLKSKRGINKAIRVPNLKLARLICEKLKKPVTATSANLSGKRECYSFYDFKKQFKNQKNLPDLFIDSGRLKKVKPSTVVRIFKNNIIILRQGPIKLWPI